jgi:UDP-N-acetylmuramyl pentapeptide synthase
VQLAHTLGYEEIYLVGEHFYRLVEETAGDKVFLNVAQLRNYLVAHPLEGAAVLVKGSRGVAMESVADVL